MIYLSKEDISFIYGLIMYFNSNKERATIKTKELENLFNQAESVLLRFKEMKGGL
jgi:hypothetical protein